MGIGTGSGENRAVLAAKTAISSPLLEVSIDGAKGILFNITGGPDMTMLEVDEAAKIITQAADPDANIIFGATIDDSLVDLIKITVIATGFDETRQKMKELTAVPQQQAVFDREETLDSHEVLVAEEEKLEDEEDVIEVPTFMRQNR